MAAAMAVVTYLGVCYASEVFGDFRMGDMNCLLSVYFMLGAFLLSFNLFQLAKSTKIHVELVELCDYTLNTFTTSGCLKLSGREVRFLNKYYEFCGFTVSMLPIVWVIIISSDFLTFDETHFRSICAILMAANSALNMLMMVCGVLATVEMLTRNATGILMGVLNSVRFNPDSHGFTEEDVEERIADFMIFYHRCNDCLGLVIELFQVTGTISMFLISLNFMIMCFLFCEWFLNDQLTPFQRTTIVFFNGMSLGVMIFLLGLAVYMDRLMEPVSGNRC